MRLSDLDKCPACGCTSLTGHGPESDWQASGGEWSPGDPTSEARCLDCGFEFDPTMPPYGAEAEYLIAHLRELVSPGVPW